MKTAEKKIELIDWISKLNDKSMLDKIDLLRKKSITRSYEKKLKPMTDDDYKSKLAESENEYKSGRVISLEDLEEEIKSW